MTGEELKRISDANAIRLLAVHGMEQSLQDCRHVPRDAVKSILTGILTMHKEMDMLLAEVWLLRGAKQQRQGQCSVN